MFISCEQFKFVCQLESNWQCIRDEYLALPKDTLIPWVQKEMYEKGWSLFSFYFVGQRIERTCALCPQTTGLIESIPGLRMASFSRLAPHTHIHPHVGWAKSVYRLHLGLVIPDEGCYLCVGDEKRAWEEGKCLIFEDIVLHEAWNTSNNERIVLMLDFLRPGITEDTDSVPQEVMQHFSAFLA